MSKTPISLVKCSAYDPAAVDAAVTRAVDLLGGIKKFVKPGERILLKPNLLSAKEPHRAITTHPEILRAVIRLVREAGATPIIGDSPGGAVKGLARVWEKTGMKALAESEKVELVSFETAGSNEYPVNHPGVKSVHLTRAAFEVDGIINLPKLKTHALLIFTGAIKNFYGCVPGLRKAEYHKLAPHPDEFGRLIGEIYLRVKPRVRLTIIDGIIGMEGNGPSSGELRSMEMIAAGADGLALDTALTALLGFKAEKIEYLRYLAANGGGESRLSAIEVKGDTPASFNLSRFKFPSNWYINLVPRFFIKFLGKYIWMKPVIIPELCKNCMLCVNSCPVKAIKEHGAGCRPEVTAPECISCLCCHELCPHNALELKSSRLSKILIRQ